LDASQLAISEEVHLGKGLRCSTIGEPHLDCDITAVRSEVMVLVDGGSEGLELNTELDPGAESGVGREKEGQNLFESKGLSGATCEAEPLKRLERGTELRYGPAVTLDGRNGQVGKHFSGTLWRKFKRWVGTLNH
jgi:hypothetical protein